MREDSEACVKRVAGGRGLGDSPALGHTVSLGPDHPSFQKPELKKRNSTSITRQSEWISS